MGSVSSYYDMSYKKIVELYEEHCRDGWSPQMFTKYLSGSSDHYYELIRTNPRFRAVYLRYTNKKSRGFLWHQMFKLQTGSWHEDYRPKLDKLDRRRKDDGELLWLGKANGITIPTSDESPLCDKLEDKTKV